MIGELSESFTSEVRKPRLRRRVGTYFTRGCLQCWMGAQSRLVRGGEPNRESSILVFRSCGLACHGVLIGQD